LAADHDDRDGLASIMRTGHEEAIREASAAQKPRQQLRAGRQYGRREEQRRPAVKKWSKNQIAEQHAKDMNAREENNMMNDATRCRGCGGQSVMKLSIATPHTSSSFSRCRY